MQPDASVNYETKWFSLNLQSVGNPPAVTLHVKLEIGVARHSKLQKYV